MVAPADLRDTYRDYLALEARSEQKHEFLGGRCWPWSGATPEHGRSAARVRQGEARVAGIDCVLPIDALYRNPLES